MLLSFVSRWLMTDLTFKVLCKYLHGYLGSMEYSVVGMTGGIYSLLLL